MLVRDEMCFWIGSTSGSKSNCVWLSIDQQAPALTSNGLLMRNERTGAEWRVPSDGTVKLRSLAALLKSTTADVTARRCALVLVLWEPSL